MSQAKWMIVGGILVYLLLRARQPDDGEKRATAADLRPSLAPSQRPKTALPSAPTTRSHPTTAFVERPIPIAVRTPNADTFLRRAPAEEIPPPTREEIHSFQSPGGSGPGFGRLGF